MPNGKYKITDASSGGSVGITNFRESSNGNPIHISGCLILLIESGYAIVSIGFKKRVLRKGCVAILFYDDIFWIEQTSGFFSTRYALLSYENVQEAIYKIASPYFWESLSENPVYLTNGRSRNMLEEWWKQMEWICEEEHTKYKDEMLRNNIHNLFMAMDYVMEREEVSANRKRNHSRTLMIRFLKLLAQYCKQTREVSFYADKLCITTTYLYKLTKKTWKMSPKEMIDQQTICEIKVYLSNTDLSVKNIAAELHFEDTPYMCRYFRKQTGVSPMEYRAGLSKI